PDSGAIGRFMEDRPKDLIFAIDEMLAGRSGLEIDPARIGVSGHSFGGWTTLNVAGSDPRIRAALPLAPAGGATPLSPGGVANVLSDGLDLAWERSVPTLYLLAEFDTLLPLAGMRDLVARTREPRIAVVLRNSDHFHFCDRVEQTHDMFSKIGPMLASGASDAESKREITDAIAGMKSSTELCPGEHAYAMTCGLGLAHMDAHVRDDERAISLLQGDLVQLMSARGVEVSLL
ncbi:MAG: dienelactone hydrolase, partial [Myxococcota bacterium]